MGKRIPAFAFLQWDPFVEGTSEPEMALITYENEGAIEEPDLSLPLLQISLKHGIPHQHACGGQARCSTCRIRVLENLENLLPRNPAELRLANKKHFDDSIRLACQTRVLGPVKIQRLVLDEQDIGLAMGADASDARLRSAAVLFSDLRNFTSFSEAHLPYDTVHILNRYFFSMGDAILRNGGYIDKYMGDGIMALFGLSEDDPERVCRQAVRAGLQMLEALKKLNRYLLDQFSVEFTMGIGIHYGEVIVGHTGHPKKKQFTAIGDTVNVASRMETATKEFHAHLFVSDAVRRQLGDCLSIGRTLDTRLRGKSGSQSLHEVLGLTPISQPLPSEIADRLRDELTQEMPLQLAPSILRLAFHDAFSYDPVRKVGGATGGIRFWKPETPAERSLQKALDWIRATKELLPPCGWGDLVALAGAVAVEVTGGPIIDLPLGRPDALCPPPHEKLPTAETSIEQLKRLFSDFGFSVREMVALSGAHTLGMAHGMPFTDDFLVFNSSYFRALLDPDWVHSAAALKTDSALVEDMECRRYVQEFAFDEERFFIDFAAAYHRMTLLGTGME